MNTDTKKESELLSYLLGIRKNSRMPFGRNLDLNIRTLREYELYKQAEREKRNQEEAEREKRRAIKALKATYDMWNAIRRHDVKGVVGLLARGADVHAVSPVGKTMVQFAEDCGHADIAEMIRARQK
jgi:hypothetical protein